MPSIEYRLQSISLLPYIYVPESNSTCVDTTGVIIVEESTNFAYKHGVGNGKSGACESEQDSTAKSQLDIIHTSLCCCRTRIKYVPTSDCQVYRSAVQVRAQSTSTGISGGVAVGVPKPS